MEKKFDFVSELNLLAKEYGDFSFSGGEVSFPFGHVHIELDDGEQLIIVTVLFEVGINHLRLVKYLASGALVKYVMIGRHVKVHVEATHGDHLTEVAFVLMHSLLLQVRVPELRRHLCKLLPDSHRCSFDLLTHLIVVGPFMEFFGVKDQSFPCAKEKITIFADAPMEGYFRYISPIEETSHLVWVKQGHILTSLLLFLGSPSLDSVEQSISVPIKTVSLREAKATAFVLNFLFRFLALLRLRCQGCLHW